MPALIGLQPLSKGARAALPWLAGGTFALAVASGAFAAPRAADSPSSGQIADIGRICQSSLGVQPGEAHYAGCVTSLSQSRAALARDLTAAAREIPAVDVNGARAGSYFTASPGEVHRREAAACARIGLDPASSGFASCVAGLQSAQFAADNPLD